MAGNTASLFPNSFPDSPYSSTILYETIPPNKVVSIRKVSLGQERNFRLLPVKQILARVSHDTNGVRKS